MDNIRNTQVKWLVESFLQILFDCGKSTARAIEYKNMVESSSDRFIKHTYYQSYTPRLIGCPGSSVEDEELEIQVL